MTKSQADVIAAMRAMGISVAMVSDADFPTLIANAINFYGGHRPRLAFGAIATTAGVGDYALPAGGIYVRDLVYDPTQSLVDPAYDDLLALLVQVEEAVPDFNEPSQMMIWRQKMSEWSRQFGGGWSQSEKGRVQIDPAPDQTGNEAIVLYTLAHTLATIPDVDEPVFFEILLWQAQRKKALELAGAAEGIAKRLGAFSYDDRGKADLATTLLQACREQEADLASRLRVGMPAERS